MTYPAGDESDDDDFYGPFSSAHIPHGLAYDIDFEMELDDDELETSETPEEDSSLPTPPIQHTHTRSLRERLQARRANAAEEVAAVLYFMNSRGLNLPIFLDLLSWGDTECITHPKIRYERSALMVSEELPSILSRWYKPQRTPTSTHRRAHGAKLPLERFAFSVVESVIEKELNDIQEVLLCPAEDLSMEELTGIRLEDLILKLSSPGFGGTPKFWSLLARVSQTNEQRMVNKKKVPDLVILSVICQIMYSRSHHHNRFAKLVTTFLRSQGAPAKTIDLLRAFGLTMSHQWSARALKTISQNEMQVVQGWVRQYPFVVTHDNVNIPFRVFTQRIDNQSHFDSGTASTIFFQPDAPPIPPLSNRTLQEFRLRGRQTPLPALQIYDLATAAASVLYERDVFLILRYLIESTEFDFASYPAKEHSIFSPPKPVNQLPTGKQYATRQFMLGTEHLEEASYEGNANVIAAILHQIKLDTEDDMKKIGLDGVIPWVGDQLTAARLRGLYGFRAQDRNSFERLDWLVFLGTTAGRGLMHAFTLLERKGLTAVQTRGPFHQQLHDAILQVAEAHFRACWKVIGNVEDLAELRSRSPIELLDIAKAIITKVACSQAIDLLDSQPELQRDQALRNSIMWNRDVLRYIDLYNATRSGDVGVMEATLPHLAFRFAGGGNSNYLAEVLELLQCLHHDWPPELCDFVRARCWLVNMTGQPNHFLPLDKRQEYNVKAIKVTDQVQGPNASWDLLKVQSPAIPTLRAVSKHVEHQVRSLARGVSHTDPSNDKDIKMLEDSYISSNIHSTEPGRTERTAADIVKDVVTQGAVKLGTKEIISRWWKKRNLLRATTETW